MELKLCPFCGGEAIFDGDEYCWVRCRCCGAETRGSEIKDIVIEQWNKRVGDNG